MKFYLYCVEDTVSKQVMPPFCSVNDNAAKRDFIVGAFMSNSIIQDLNLWKIGEFNSCMALNDDESSTISLLPIEKTLVRPSISEIEAVSQEVEKYKEIYKLKELNENVR